MVFFYYIHPPSFFTCNTLGSYNFNHIRKYVYGFTSRPLQNFSVNMETSPLPVKCFKLFLKTGLTLQQQKNRPHYTQK